MAAGSAVLAAVQRPELLSGLVLVGPFVRNPTVGAGRRVLLRVATAPLWAAISWKSYLPKLYAGRRPADFGEYRDQVVASLRRPGYARAFSLTTRTSHASARARLAEVTAPALIVMGEQDPDFGDPAGEAAGPQASRPQASQPGLQPCTYSPGASPRGGYRLLPRPGGVISSPARASDQAVQSSHHEPLCLLFAARQASGSGPA
jgi:pimeloyl-ACP methyl ester carboxylesterase